MIEKLKQDDELIKKCAICTPSDDISIEDDMARLCIVAVHDSEIDDELKLVSANKVHHVNIIHFSTPFKHCDSSAIDFYLRNEGQLKPDLGQYRRRLKSIPLLERNVHIVPDSPSNAFDHVLKCVGYYEMHSDTLSKDSLLSEKQFHEMFQEKHDSLPKFQLNRIGFKDEDDLRLMKKFQQLMLLSKELDETDSKTNEHVDDSKDPDDPFL